MWTMVQTSLTYDKWQKGGILSLNLNNGIYSENKVEMSPDLKGLQQVSDVFSNSASALCGRGVVRVSQEQPVGNHHVDVD